MNDYRPEGMKDTVRKNVFFRANHHHLTGFSRLIRRPLTTFRINYYLLKLSVTSNHLTNHQTLALLQADSKFIFIQLVT